MRLLATAVVLCSLISTAAFAQGTPAPGSAPQNNSRSFGSADCRPLVPCDNPDAASMISQANACLNLHFGYPIGGGFFDEMAGLDQNNCLTAKPNVLPKGVGLQLSPVCCIIPPDDSSVKTCKLHCELMSGMH